MTQIGYPYGFDASGRTRETDEGGHIRDMIEQVLLTSPGERVNRPDFGSGLAALVFEPNSDALAALTRARVEGAIQHWLAEEVALEGVVVRNDGATLEITVQYVVRRTQERKVERVRLPGAM